MHETGRAAFNISIGYIFPQISKQVYSEGSRLQIRFRFRKLKPNTCIRQNEGSDEVRIFFRHFDSNCTAARNTQQVDRTKSQLFNEGAHIVGVLRE